MAELKTDCRSASRNRATTRLVPWRQSRFDEQPGDSYCGGVNLPPLTIHQLPAELNQALQQTAREMKRSVDEIAVAALTKGLPLIAGKRFHDLDHLAGTWQEDPAFDEAIRAQNQVDGSLWR